MDADSLNALFSPKTVAVIGAKDTEGSVSSIIMQNLMNAGFSGAIYPVNPHRAEVFGKKCFETVGAIPDQIDLAVIVVPAHAVVDVMKTCVDAHVKAAIVIAAGFKETGAEGARLEQMVLQIAKDGNIRMLGPNCLGVMNPIAHLNASFAHGNPLPGSIAFISQSGAMCSAVLDWSLERKIGFSAFVSIGSMADIAWEDLIRYFGKDPHTKTILLYMETIGDPREFITAAMHVALDKAIIVIKPGRSEDAARAASSHTGALVGSDAVFDAACERAGVQRVNSIEQLFDMAEVQSGQKRSYGPHLAIISNAGGPAVLATDAAVGSGAKLSLLSETTIKKLSKELPDAWSHGNPIDILGDADSARYKKALEIVSQDPATNGILVILTPQEMTHAEKVAQTIAQFPLKKPLLASFMGASAVKEARNILAAASIPQFEYPDEAATCFAKAWNHELLLQNLCEIPRFRPYPEKEIRTVRRDQVKAIITEAIREKRSILSERESKNILKLYGIPVVESFLAKKPEEAIVLAKKVGFPVVLKIESSRITHKTDVGGVFLNLQNPQEVLSAFSSIKEKMISLYGKGFFEGVTVQKMISTPGIELFAGSYKDAQFGPVLVFGAGGIYVEVLQDKKLGLPPLSSVNARHMIQNTKISTLFRGYRGQKNIPQEPIEEILIALGEIVLENAEIAEVDINPFIASSCGVLCIDARIIVSKMVHDFHSAFPSFSSDLTDCVKLSNKSVVLIAPARPEDASLMSRFEEKLSHQKNYMKIFSHPFFEKRIIREELVHMCIGFTRWSNVVIAQSELDQRHVVGIAAMDDDRKIFVALDDRYASTDIEERLISYVQRLSKMIG